LLSFYDLSDVYQCPNYMLGVRSGCVNRGIKITGRDGMEWIKLALAAVTWWPLVNTIMNLSVQ
jgi:hypothetical protein